MKIRQKIYLLVAFLVLMGITLIIVKQTGGKAEDKENAVEKKVIGYVREIKENRLVVDDGVYLYEFGNLDNSVILLVNQAMQAKKVDWQVLKEYAALEQKIEVNYLQREKGTELLEVIISLNKAWAGKLDSIDLENNKLSLRGDNKVLVFANDEKKGMDQNTGDEVMIWVEYNQTRKKFIIDKIQ